MLRMTLPKGWETMAPAFLISFTSPLRTFMARGRSSVRRVSMQVTIASLLSGKRSVRYCSYSLLETKEALWERMSEIRDISSSLCARGVYNEIVEMTMHEVPHEAIDR